MRSEKPLMIYIPSDDEGNRDNRKLEDLAFKSEKLAIGAKFFRTVRLSIGDAMQDRLLKDVGRSAPRIVFMSRSYEVEAVLENKQLSPGKIVKAMKKVVRKEYKSNFDKLFKSYTKLLNELDRLEARKAQVKDTKARLREKPNASKQRKLERMEKEVKKDAEALEAREAKLLDFAPKDGPEA